MPHRGVTFREMRKLLSALLLFCVGIMVSASATPVRVCLLSLAPEIATEDSSCCHECKEHKEKPDPCCHHLAGLPDSPVPLDPVELPPAVIVDLPPVTFECPVAIIPAPEKRHVSGPIRGPTSPAARRAFLGIWRL